MKRDIRLHGLSSEHHNALVLCRTLSRRVEAGTADEALAKELAERFATEIEEHFQVEDELLLPALRRLGEDELVARTEADHAALRAGAARAATGDFSGLGEFAERMVAHVRFEERVLFPRCEELLPAELLDQVAHRSPKPIPACRGG